MSKALPEDARGAVALTIRRPVGVVVAVILVLLFGVLNLRSLPIQLTPDVQQPSLSVSTFWPGAAPDEVARQVIEPQEEVLKSVAGLDRMTSTARQSQANIDLEFRVGTDLNDALVRVSNRLAEVSDYPLNVEEPSIETASSSGPPLAVILLQSKDGGPVGHFRTWGDEELVSRLQRVPGVAAVDYFGGRDRTVEVIFNPADLAARGVGVVDLTRALQGELRDLSAGDMTLGKRSYQVRTLVTPTVPEDLHSLVLKVTGDGRAVRLGDVATARMGLSKPGAYVFGNGSESIAMLLRREAGTNVLEVTEQIQAVVDELQRTRLDPEGLELRMVGDQTGYITEALSLVRQNILIGGVLAVIVLLLFLRSARASAVIATAIPVCILGTGLGMALVGRTVNVVSLAGMAFAVGMVVDNAIVVLENIDTWYRRTLAEDDTDRLRAAGIAALKGTSEVWGAILASTMTTAAVFVPIILWEDEVGALLRDVAVAIVFAVLISLVVSVLVIPSFAAVMLSRRESLPSLKGVAQRAANLRERVVTAVRWIVARTGRSLVVVGGTVAIAGIIVTTLLPPMEYLPTGSRNFLFGMVLPPPGYSTEEMARIGQGVQDQFVAHIADEDTGQAVPAIGRTFFVARGERAFLGASAIDGDRIGELVNYSRGVLAGVPGVRGLVFQAALFGRSIGGSRSIDLDISGGDTATLVGVGRKLMGTIDAALPGSQVRPIPNLDEGAPELRVVPRRERAAALGLSASDIGAAVDALVDGRKIGEIGLVGEPRLDVMLQAKWGAPAGDSPINAPAVGAKTPVELAGAPIATNALLRGAGGGTGARGEVVPLSAIADVTEAIAPTLIQRIERRTAITLQITPPQSLPLEQAIEAVNTEVIAPTRASGELPDGVRLDISGTAGKLESAQSRMVGVLALAVLISYLLMAGLFEDFVAPIVILVVVPFAAAGGVLGLRLVDLTIAQQGFDMMTALGFVILIGVVVNNAILVVDGSLARLREGASLADATSRAVEGRVRPIFMSTLTSMAGLMPMVLFPGSGAELYRGVGSVVLGGLLVATLLTVFVVPAMFSLVWRTLGRAS